MTEDRLLECLDLWGSTLARWPAAERTQAEALLASSEKARDLLTREQMMERLLQSADPVDMLDTAALDRVKAAVFASIASPPLKRAAPPLTVQIADRLRRWFDLPDPVAPWGLRLASVVLVAALLGSLTARSITLTTSSSGTALEQIAMATPYSPLDVQ